MADEPPVKYSVLIPKSQHKILKQASLDREVSMQVLVRRAVDIVLAELLGSSDSPASGGGHSTHKPDGGVVIDSSSEYSEVTLKNEYAAEVAMFVRLLREGPAVVRRAIIENVRAFDALREMVAAQHERTRPESSADAERRLAELLDSIESDLDEAERRGKKVRPARRRSA